MELEGRPSFVWSLRGLISAIGLLSLFVPAVAEPASSVLSEANGTVPDYVTKHAPLVWLHHEDPFGPSDLLKHLRHTTPMVDREPIPDLPELDLDNLEILNQYGKNGEQVALTSNDDVTTHHKWLRGETPDTSGIIHDATPCYVILVDKNPRDVDAYFFYFYSYDRGANITQVVEPLDQLFDLNATQLAMHYGDHVGDWENNMIRFRDGKPTGIYYSQHSDGSAYDWDDDTVSKTDGRPIVYSAYGSHANYPTPGDHIHDEALVDYCDAGRQWDPVRSAYFYRLDPDSFTLTRLFPSESSASDSNLTSFFYFTGRWGDMRYPDDDPRQEIIPYFKLRRFNSGPTGPRAKQLIRKGLYPDHRRTKSWTEWGVGVYLSLYPCCLKGWRAWVTTAFLIAILVVMVLGIRQGVKKYRRRGYTKVDTEIPMHEMGRRDSIESSRL